LNITFLLHFSWLFERDEARADVYPMVRYWIENNDSDLEKIRAIATLLYIWNIGYYGRAGKNFSFAVNNVEEIYYKQKFNKLLNSLKNHELSNIDLNKYKIEIKEIYRLVKSCTGFGVAATSKLLHIIHPELFIMWDKAICNHYHDIHKKKGMWHLKGHDVCYFEFLKEMQKEIKDILRQSSIKKVEQGLNEISGYKKTIVKGLDEVNYMIITVPEKKHEMRKRLRFRNR